MKLVYENLTRFARTLPGYDGHAVHSLVDKSGKIHMATFIHREGAGIFSQHGPRIRCGGGTRRWVYDGDIGAFVDGMRLSRGMSAKFAGLDLPIGGAKSVIFGHNIPQIMHDEKLLQEMLVQFGELLLPQIATYLTAEDVHTTPEHMNFLKDHAPKGLVTGFERDVSMVTALGVAHGTKIAMKKRFGNFITLSDGDFILQGVGAVGGYIVDHLLEEGARRIVICDNRPQRAEEVRTKNPDRISIVSCDDIYDEVGDVFMPCALGGTINEHTIPRLNAPVVAGCANNQLDRERDAELLHAARITYAPDYIINAGGLIAVVCDSILGKPVETLMHKIDDNLAYIFDESRKTDEPTATVAERMIAERIAKLELPL